MALRTTGAAVKELINTTLTADTIEASHLVTANLLVDEELLGYGYSSARLAEIEKWLAAHFVALTEERGSLLEEEIDDTVEKTANVYSAGLSSTRYGQQAMIIDTGGKLASLSKAASKPKASFRVI